MNADVPSQKRRVFAMFAAILWVAGCGHNNAVTGVNTRPTAKPLDKSTPETAALENAKSYFKSMGPELENKVLNAVTSLSDGLGGNKAASALLLLDLFSNKSGTLVGEQADLERRWKLLEAALPAFAGLNKDEQTLLVAALRAGANANWAVPVAAGLVDAIVSVIKTHPADFNSVVSNGPTQNTWLGLGAFSKNVATKSISLEPASTAFAAEPAAWSAALSVTVGESAASRVQKSNGNLSATENANLVQTGLQYLFKDTRVLKASTTDIEKVYAKWATGASPQTAVASVLGKAPTSPTVALSPTSLNVDSSPVCAASGSTSSEGGTIQYSYEWSLNGVALANQTSPHWIIQTGLFKRGDRLSCAVVASDSILTSSSVTTGDVVLGNASPRISSVAISGNAVPSAALSCDAVAVDSDADVVTVSYVWKSGSNATNGVAISGQTARTLTLAGPDVGNFISCVASGNDGHGGTDFKESAAVQVTNSNAVPVLASVTTDGPKAVTQVVTGAQSATDADGDSLTFAKQWQQSSDNVTFADVSGATNTTLTLTTSQAHKYIRFKVTVTDGHGGSVTANSTSFYVSNTAPTAATVSLTPTTAYKSSTLTCGASASTDADGDTVSYTYRWKKNAAIMAGQTSSTLTSASGTGFVKTDGISCEATATDLLTPAAPVASSVVTIQNSAPSAPSSVSISPNTNVSPATATLTCSASGATDADSDSLTYQYQWKVNSSVVSAWSGTATLSNSNYSHGQNVVCEARATDGTMAGSLLASSSVSVGNSLPSISSATTDGPKMVGQTVTASTSSSDADGDSLSTSYQWQQSSDGSTFADIASANSSTFVLTTTQAHKYVRAKITVDDSNGGSANLNTSAFMVSNAAPTAPTVSISPSTAYKSSTLTCSAAGSTDADTDSISYTHTWSKNAIPISGQTSSTLAGQFVKGDSITCSATATDLITQSSTVVASAVVIQNTAPTQPTTAAVTYTTPNKLGTFTCGRAGGSDADGDSTTPVYAWQVDGVAISGQTASTLAGSNASVIRGKSVTCSVALNDGTTTGSARTSSGVTVLNVAPQISCTWGGGALNSTQSLAQGAALSSQMTCGATDSDTTDTFTWSVSGCSSQFTINSGSGVLSGTMPDGQCTLSVSVSDGAASSSASVKLTPILSGNPRILGDIYAVAAHPDGDIMVGGNFTAVGGEVVNGLLVTHPNGDRDFRYKSFSGGSISSIYPYSDGKLLVVGDFSSYGTTDVPHIVRLNADGSIDTAFMSNVGSGPDDNLGGVAVHTTSGRIYVAGRFDKWSGANRAGIYSMNADGTENTTFKLGDGYITSGGARTNWTPDKYDFTFDPDHIALNQSNEDVYVAGDFNNFAGETATKIARFDSTGYLDERFTRNVGPDEVPVGLAWNPVSSNLILFGNFHNYQGNDVSSNKLISVNSTADLNMTFLTNEDELYCVRNAKVLADGDILAFGCFDSVSQNNSYRGFVRLNSNGTTDSSTVASNDTGFDPLDGFLDSNGKLVAVGSFNSFNSLTTPGGIVRVNTNGTIDNSFDTGFGVSGWSQWNPEARIAMEMGDGRIAIAGSVKAYRTMRDANTLAKFNPLTGVLDTNFMSTAYAEENVRSIVVDVPNSKIYFGGFFNAFGGNGNLNGVARTNLLGVIDSGFTGPATDEFDVLSLALAPSYASDVNISNDIYVFGLAPMNPNGSSGAGNQWAIRRLNSDGSFDTHFVPQNFTTYRDNYWQDGVDWGFWDSTSRKPLSMSFNTSDGRLYVAGSFSKYGTNYVTDIMALDSTGALVSTTVDGSGNVASTKAFDSGEGIQDAPQKTLLTGGTTGDLLVAGLFDSYYDVGSDNLSGVMRLDSFGEDVAAFNGGTDVSFDAFDMAINGTTLYVGGYFTSYHGTSTAPDIIAVNVNTGAKVAPSTFNAGAGFSGGSVFNIAIVTISGTKYLFAQGDFTSYNGNPALGTALLQMDGTFAH